MSKTKHTPGPWGIRYDYVVQAQSFDGGRLVPVAQPYGVNVNGADLFANARLIAAAPDMFESLQEIVAAADGAGWSQLDATLAKARAAIAKATGEQ